MGNQSRRRAGLPTCTGNMLEMMKHIRDKGNPFAYVDDVDPRTIRALVIRDWIVQSSGIKEGSRKRERIDEDRYRLTPRGERALKVYEIPPEEYAKRSDGICCRCGKNERGYYSTGRRKPYCDDCLKKIAARKYALLGYQKNPGICPKCGKREKHIQANGKVRSYCKPCRRKLSKRRRKRRNKNLVKRAKAGEVFLCYRCHERPRYLTGNTLQDYCRPCQLEYQRERRKAVRDDS